MSGHDSDVLLSYVGIFDIFDVHLRLCCGVLC